MILEFYRYFLGSNLRFVVFTLFAALILFASDIIKLRLGIYRFQDKLSKRIVFYSRIKGIIIIVCLLLVSISIGVDSFAKMNYSAEQISRVISVETVSLLMQVMMLYIPIALSIIAVTAIFKEKSFGVEISSYLPILAKGYILNFRPKFLMIVLGLVSVTSIIVYQLQFRFTIVLLSLIGMTFTIFMIRHLYTYLFSHEKLVEKIKLCIEDLYNRYPYLDKDLDAYDFPSRLFDYGASIEKEEHIKMISFFSLVFSIYEQSIIKYQEHNEIEIPPIDEMDKEERDILGENADNALFLKGYLIDNICYFLFLLMQKDDRKHFFQLTHFIRHINHIVRRTEEGTVFDDLDDFPTTYLYWIIHEEHFVREEFIDSLAITFQRKLNGRYKKSILESWMSGIKEMFLDFTSPLYEKEVSELLGYLEAQEKKIHAHNDALDTSP